MGFNSAFKGLKL